VRPRTTEGPDHPPAFVSHPRAGAHRRRTVGDAPPRPSQDAVSAVGARTARLVTLSRRARRRSVTVPAARGVEGSDLRGTNSAVPAPDPAAESVACVACGTPTPRAEMFGLPPDLRCPPCAQGLGQRMHPSHVRRTASSRALTSAAEPHATAAIVGAAVVLWLATVFESPVQDLIYRVLLWGVTTTPVGDDFVLGGHPQPWQFVGWAFLHGGFVHLLMNGLSLWQLGKFVEWGWGARTFSLVLVGSAAASVAASWMWTGHFTVGLSGGIFALIGWLLPQRRTHVFAAAIVNRVFLNSVLASVVLLLVLTEVGGWRISHVGHAAGFLWGLAAGTIPASRRPALGWSLLAAVTLAVLLLPTFAEPLHWRGTLFRHAG
jgi:membrane associated rhomboid family serine protease